MIELGPPRRRELCAVMCKPPERTPSERVRISSVPEGVHDALQIMMNRHGEELLDEFGDMYALAVKDAQVSRENGRQLDEGRIRPRATVLRPPELGA